MISDRHTERQLREDQIGAGEVVEPPVPDAPAAYSDSSTMEPALHFVTKNGIFGVRIYEQLHAIIVVLLIVILLLTPIILLVGVVTTDRSWVGPIFDWVGKAFLLLVGVLVGGRVGNGRGAQR
jgi:hypothetical protein